MVHFTRHYLRLVLRLIPMIGFIWLVVQITNTSAQGLSQQSAVASASITNFICDLANRVGQAFTSLANQARPAQTAILFLPLTLHSGSLPTIVSGYKIHGPGPEYALTRYQPRQFMAGRQLGPESALIQVDATSRYTGWDVFIPPYAGINQLLDIPNWVELSFTRPAQVAIAWRAGGTPPNWLRQWPTGPTIQLDGEVVPTFIQQVPAGILALGSVFDPNQNGDPRRPYLVLIGEVDGQASRQPSTPVGREIPQPNTSCPSWVHDQYVALGPDGKQYRTWHPPIDPVYWCYFHHEHGSQPGQYTPLFGYGSGQAGIDERHEGFKVYRFVYPDAIEIVISHHFGTGSARRAACVRFHSYDMAIYQHTQLMADVHLMGDHGKAVHARTDQALVPTDCPDQAAQADADGSLGTRKFQIATQQPVSYEPWFIDFHQVVLGSLTGITINTASRIADCNTINCDADVPTGDQGEFRFLSHGPNFGLRAAQWTGVFYTDPTARQVVSADTPGAVRQFIVPGLQISLPAIPDDVECYMSHPFGGPYLCQQQGPQEDMNLEGSYRNPN